MSTAELIVLLADRSMAVPRSTSRDTPNADGDQAPSAMSAWSMPSIGIRIAMASSELLGA